MPPSGELLTMQLEVELSLAVTLASIADGLPSTAIPNDDCPSPILAFGDCPLEVPVLERMVLDMNRETLLARDQAWASGHRPTLEDPVHLQPEVVVKPAGGMFLDDKAIPTTLPPAGPTGTSGFRRRSEVSLFPVSFERHLGNLATEPARPTAQPLLQTLG
jgi:hypothetical protein